MAGNIWLRMMLKINVRCLSLAAGNEWRQHSAPYDAKINVGCLSFTLEMKLWFYLAQFAAKKIGSFPLA